jgi:very-short-patch-repair endonuclease
VDICGESAMKNINESYVIKKYQEGHSCAQIAEEFDTYSKKIERVLKKNGIQTRSKSKAAKMAHKSGRAIPPNKGKKRTEKDKVAISKGMQTSWQNKSTEEREEFSKGAKERWENMDPIKKREMQEKAGRALRKACTEGSKAEKFLKEKLQSNGIEVVMHKKGLVEGKFEIDLLLPELNTIIEIDGPQHFLPVFGEERLAQVVKMDSIKNGLLIGKGFCVIRIKYLCKNMNKTVERKLWEAVSIQIEKIKAAFPPKSKRFIELEIS